MEVLINELSLKGQFENENDFFDSFDCVLLIFKVLDDIKFALSKEEILFEAYITNKLKLQDLLILRSDKTRKMKSFLSKLITSPSSWNNNRKHQCKNDIYIYNSENICNTSLAESCERDKIIISFKHNDFIKNNLKVQKNNTNVDIFNITNKRDFLEHLFIINKIEPLYYCKEKYKNSNLNFNSLENEYGFDILNFNQKNEFINAFNMFSNMTWGDIMYSDGLEYKKYKKPKKLKITGWFRKGAYSDTDIYKFRTTQGYRCFGYREENIFYVLRFEINHKISDKG